MEKNYFAAIEFNGLSINILILSYFCNSYNVIASSSTDCKGYENGEIIDYDAFNASLDNALENIKSKYKVTIDEIILVLPNNDHKVYSASLNNKILTERQIIGKAQVDAIRKQLRSAKVNEGEVLVDEVPTLYSLDNNRHLRSAPIGQRSSMLVIKSNIHTLPKRNIEPLYNILNEKGINVIGSAINCQCGVRALLNTLQLEKECIHINIGGDTTTISAYHKNVLYKSKCLQFGVKTLICYLANTLKIDFETSKDLLESYLVCDIDLANDVIFDNELNLSERRISGILLNRLNNAFNQILDACNELITEFNFSDEHFILCSGYLNDYPSFIDELCSYSSLEIKSQEINVIGIDSQIFVNCYGAIIDFVNKNPEFIKSKIEKDEQIEINLSNIKNNSNSTSGSRFVDIFDD